MLITSYPVPSIEFNFLHYMYKIPQWYCTLQSKVQYGSKNSMASFWPRATLKGPKRGFVVVVLILVLVVGGRGIILKRTKNVRDEAKNFCNQMAPNGANKVSKGTKNVAKRIKNVAKGTKNVTNETLWPW